MVGGFRPNEAIIREATATQQTGDTFFFAQDDDGDRWDCGPISELNIAHLKTTNVLDYFFLGRAIPVDGRTEAAVKKDAERLRSWAKQIGGKG
jgi:hypothetical protein